MREGKDDGEEEEGDADEGGDEADEHAEGGRDTFAAAEFHVGREHVTEDAGDADGEREPREGGGRVGFRGESWKQAFEDVAGKGEEAPLFADGTEDVRGADVLGADGAHVNAAEATDEIAEWNATDEVCGEKPDGWNEVS